MTVHEIGSKYEIAITPNSGIGGRETRIFEAALAVFGQGTVSIFVGIDNGDTVIKISGYDIKERPEPFNVRLQKLNSILNEK